MSSIQGLQKQEGAYAEQSQVKSHQISTPVHGLCYFPFSWNGAPATVTKIVPAIPCNHTYFSSPIAIGSKVAPRSLVARGSAVNVSLHYGLCSPLCVSGSPRSAQSALWTPAGPPWAGRSGRRPACLRAGRTWPDREGAAEGAPGDTWSGCSAGGRRSRTALPPAASANPSGPCRRRHLHRETRVGESRRRPAGGRDGSCTEEILTASMLLSKYKYFVPGLRCIFQVSVLY